MRTPLEQSRRQARLVVRTVVATCITALVVGVHAGPASAATKIIQGMVSHGALQWPEYVAQEKGWFKEKGIEHELIATRGGSGGAQELASGDLHLSYSGFPDFMRAINKGAPEKIIINCIGVPPYGLYSKKEIKSVADLKGKTVSVGGTKDVTLIYVEAMTKPGGVTAKDMNFIYAKATPARFAALVSGGADATILFPPFTYRAEQQGFTNLGYINKVLPDFPFTVMAANNAWAEKNKDALMGYVASYGRATRWLYDPANRAEAVSILVKYSNAKPEDAEPTYDFFIRDVKALSPTGLFSPAAYKQMTDALIDFEDIAPPVPPMSKFIDESYVRTAWESWK